MPSSQSSKGKVAKSRSRDSRSLSRATASPAPPAPSALHASSPSSSSQSTSAYLHTPLSSLLVPPALSIESLIEQRHSPNSTNPPSAASLHALHDDIANRVLRHVVSRAQVCDKGMRELSKKRKERIEEERSRDEERERESERKKRHLNKVPEKKEADDHDDHVFNDGVSVVVAARDNTDVEIDGNPRVDEEEKDKKKNHEDNDNDDKSANDRPPTVGAHGLARQDGVDALKAPKAASPSSISASVDATVSTSAAAPAASEDAPSPSISEASHQPPPAPAVAHYESFGEDPTKYNDPTVYHIRDITPDMTDEEKKEILCVSRYPHDDLHELTPGTPPDMDFSNAKPPNQINFSTFQTFAESYIRPLTEEDVAFLKERGDRVTPYIMPPRGPMPYRELWAKEDGVSHHDFNRHLPPNEARGSIENMTDDIAETDEISNGPVMSRLLQVLRHDPNTTNPDSSTQQNGDVTMANGESTAGNHEGEPPTTQTNGDDETVVTFKPSTHFPEISGSTYRFPAASARDVSSLEQRTLQELRYTGFLTPDATPDYDSHYDDEVAARLRHLQAELQYIARENGARKARVLELTEERMAMQEYSTIADDLDTQINTAYLKRNRTMSKPKKGVNKARPGQSGTGGVAISRNTVSEGVRMLMDRRKEWTDLIGPVVEFGQTRIPKETVFDKASMERLDKAEAEVGDAEGE